MYEQIWLASFQWFEEKMATHGGILPRNVLADDLTSMDGSRITKLCYQGI
jgi:hypothetical protein